MLEDAGKYKKRIVVYQDKGSPRGYPFFMHFIGWLEEQPELQITKIIMLDFNNGCLRPVRNAKELREHFETKHPYNGKAINTLLAAAFQAYKEDLDG